jgi:cysteine desulfurase
VQAIAAMATQAKSVRAWFHTDAVQAFGKRALDFRALNAAGVHAMTLSAHKLGGPKGAGALVVDKRVDLQPLIAGGGHERGCARAPRMSRRSSVSALPPNSWLPRSTPAKNGW